MDQQVPTTELTRDSEEEVTETKRLRRALIPAQDRRWPNGRVPYVLTNASPKAREVFLAAARQISLNSSLHFFERTDEPDYVYLAEDNHYPQCHSRKGKIGGPQELALSPSCQTVGEALHELMHTLSFLHEHQRSDRDQHIVVNQKSFGVRLNPKQYEKVKDAIILGSYDLNSVMHYDIDPQNQLEISLRDPNTIVRTWPRSTLSPGDIAGLNILYGGTPNTAPMPTDNQLKVVLSKHELILPENGTGTVVLQVLPNVYLARAPQLISENPLITATIDSQAGNTFTLKIQAQPATTTEVLNRVFFHFLTSEGKAGTGIFTVKVVDGTKVQQSFRQLVSSWRPAGSDKKQCLEARRLPANAQLNPGITPDNEVLQAVFNDDQLSIAIAPCDANKPLQLWRQDKDGYLVSRTEIHCLAPLKQVGEKMDMARLHLNNKCEKNTPPITYKWRYENGKLINVAFPATALSYAAGDVPVMAKIDNSQPSWQHWYWY
ncbi:astacin family metallopeptidase [Chitinimonas sp. BJB300]|uniref:astacin family metallopeptidase n=1 Tax=Chitinimonas sp. BJB300 TaxID=1559339 RepID=UPI002100D429|nr:astacin family metallopeptidase [Chitinimonas sp. BJB300]